MIPSTCFLNESKILICGYTYTLFFRHAPIIKDGDLCEGWCDNAYQAIEIDVKLGHDRIRDIVMHEIIHAIYHIYGDRENWDQETVCDLIGHGLVGVLKSNPVLMSWLAEKKD
jgi:hypothetical protein